MMDPIVAWVAIVTVVSWLLAVGIRLVWIARRRRRHDLAVARFNAAIASYMVRDRQRTTRRRADPRIQRRRTLRLDRDR